MDIQLYHDYVLIKPDRSRILEETTLEIPENAVPLPDTGEVLAHGPGMWKDKKFTPIAVTPGMKVIFEPRSADKLELNGESFLLVREPYIFAEIQ